MKQLKYEVFACDRAGTPWPVAQMSEPELALHTLELCRMKRWPNDRVFGVYETDDPEKGDVETELEELLDERRCAWCKRLPIQGCDTAVHNEEVK